MHKLSQMNRVQLLSSPEEMAEISDRITPRSAGQAWIGLMIMTVQKQNSHEARPSSDPSSLVLSFPLPLFYIDQSTFVTNQHILYIQGSGGDGFRSRGKYQPSIHHPNIPISFQNLFYTPPSLGSSFHLG